MMPRSPSVPAATIISTRPEYSDCSALTMSQCTVIAIPSYLRGLLALTLVVSLENFIDAALHVEILLRDMIEITLQDSLETTDGFFQGNVFTRRTGEHFRHVERLRQETLDLTRAVHHLLVFLGQFVHAENRDDVLQFLVALQNRLHAASHFVVLDADNQRIQLAGGGIQRIYRRINTFRSNITAQYHGRIKVREGGRRGRVSQVIRRYVYRLDGGDGASLGGGNTLLQNAHLFRQGRLVTYRRRH